MLKTVFLSLVISHIQTVLAIETCYFFNEFTVTIYISSL